MKMREKKTGVLLTAIVLIVLCAAGCAGKQKKVVEATQPETSPVQQDSAEDEALYEQARQAGALQNVYFDYDKYNLKPEALKRLDKTASWLASNPDVAIRISGHCDERGTNEYNLALGERRAVSARSYLAGKGISESRIETISYGEEMPAAPGQDEQAWSQNRRDEFKLYR